MAITDWPMEERPREKMLQMGPESLSDGELLAIFLRVGVPGKTAVDLARELLSEFGDLRQLLDADLAVFSKIHGMGPAKYVQLQAALEVGKRYLEKSINAGDAITNPEKIKQFLKAKMRAYQQEVFSCVFLDNQHRILDYKELFYGTIDGASVYPREVVKQTLAFNAAAVIFAHNHPSGIAEPSQADKKITERLVKALNLVDVRVLDHMIVGDDEVVSFAERGLL
jgi:DNA repair protein RadC